MPKALKGPKKYVYAAVLAGGHFMRDTFNQPIISDDPGTVRERAQASAPKATFRVLRYVLESSVRPGGA